MTFRVFWFALGGLTAAWWIKHPKIHAEREAKAKAIAGGRRDDSKANQPTATLNECQSWAWHYRWPREKAQSEWEEETAKMMGLSRAATDNLTEMSEVALDTLMATATALKTRLAESRAQREQAEQEQRKLPPPTRWV
ncbi:hypothetical protein C8J56DRAFT_953407 [Mycena floridula]|nr:hypothetical protein C8J56DRAFT_953407 [Mycena floridula]